MRKTILFIYLLIFISLIGVIDSCTGESGKSKSDPSEVTVELSMEKGFYLLQSNCFSCHNPNPEFTNPVAPTIAEISKTYKDSYGSKGEFTAAFVEFMSDPSAQNALMTSSVKRFGPMPKMNFKKEDVVHIAHYIFENKTEDYKWFAENYESDKKKYSGSAIELSYEERGKDFAMRTKAILGKNLLGALRDKGTEGALIFCNHKAYPLTDSMATALNAEIKRVSDKARNPANRATGQELEYIQECHEIIMEGGAPGSKIMEVDNKVKGFYPIITNAMCLQCHGNAGTDITPSVLAKIDALYPYDEARGYGENEMRGLFVITFDK